MLLEISTSILFGSLALKAHMSRKGNTSNDSGKIQKIISLSGLNVKDGKRTLTTQLIRKKRHDWGWEYKYRIPLGRSFNDYLNKQQILQDGLNNRRHKITLADLKELSWSWDGNIIEDIQNLRTNKLQDEREIELSFDGLLIIRVYNDPMPKEIPFKPGNAWRIPVGVVRGNNEFRYHDFEKVPHMVLGGSSGYGKSVFLNSMIVSLLQSKPEHVHFYLIDLKGGVELCDYENIKQTVSIAYEPEEALQTLQVAYQKMRDIQTKLRMMGKKNVVEGGIKERHFVIIDEAGELNPKEAVTREERQLKEECQKIMSQIARIGRSNGFRQVLATQYPVGDCLPRQVKQNSDAKLCFRVQSETASRVVLDNEGAEQLPQIKGRAIFQNADQREILQTPLITTEIIEETISRHVVKPVTEKADPKNVIRFTPSKGGDKVVERKARENLVTFEEV
ncbi:FtsK/SpoIIIE domain-containing protein [Sporosarcina highlanderae]|uniref:FtsK/SpoIIIE domain-containing protein n=1 Tax=Sporosarcina highlanderae TaxID=3035916 RepID=A0ABT8JVZ0_9BACL|nr:FtsK/SpoIIIE domain-containing protein [Sporosarcina highlanderae]MDN4609102.1 FtsK/SpoIIIE domain-containing protein [Sporosarcina highlanderae]